MRKIVVAMITQWKWHRIQQFYIIFKRNILKVYLLKIWNKWKRILKMFIKKEKILWNLWRNIYIISYVYIWLLEGSVIIITKQFNLKQKLIIWIKKSIFTSSNENGKLNDLYDWKNKLNNSKKLIMHLNQLKITNHK